jgi:hypothetical protein
MRTRALASLSILFVLAVVLARSALAAQEGRATITGRVTDESGGVVAAAEIRVTNKETGATAAAHSNETGNYTIPYLLPGTYTLSVELSGFKKTDRQGIQVRVGDVLNIDLAMQIGDRTESVEVSAAAPLLESANVSLGQVVDQRRLTELPIQAGNAEELVLLAPGVVNTTNLKARKASFNNAASQFSTDGGAQFSNEYTIDGVPNTFAVGSNPVVAFQPPQSAVSEFKVQTSAFDAAVGHTPGALVNLITKGGTSQVHGELHEWLVNGALDAPTFFLNRSGQPKQVYQDNRYGASVGGPVLLPGIYDGSRKSFFFYAWEANKWGKPTSVVGTVPTAAEKNGDLSALLALGSNYQIYNPFTTQAASGGHFTRLPFMCDGAGNPLTPNAKGIQPAGTPCNKIPSSLIDPVAKKIMSYYADPNTAGNADGSSNYTRATNDTFNYYVHFFRFDHNFSEANRLFVRADYDYQLEDQSNFYGNTATGLLLNRINRGLALDDVLVLSSSSVLDVRYGITNTETPERRRSSGFDVASLGYSPSLLGLLDPSVATFPNVYINTKASTTPCQGPCTGTFSGFGNFRDGDGRTTGIVHALAATFNTFRGKHNLRYGTDLRLYRSFGARGGYDVSPGFQFLPTYTGASDTASPAPIGQDFAAFLLGIPSGQMQRSASYATQDKFVGHFVQDDWKLKPALTFNIGLRYEYESPETERYDRAVRGFDRTTPNPVEALAQSNYAKSPIAELPADQFRVLGGLMFTGANNRNLWEGQKANFQPRLGLAYELNDKTVVRAGYGIYYDTIGVNRSPAIQTGFTATTPINASLDNGLTYVATTANPFPNGLQSPLGAPGGLTTNLGQSLTVYPVNRSQPYAHRWALSVQRLLPGQFLVDVGYVGNRGVHLPVMRELNPINPQYLSQSPERDQKTIDFLSEKFPNPFFGINSVYSKSITRADLLRPYPEFGSIIETQSIGYSLYNALQLRAEKRFSQGYTLNVAYTWSKAMDALRFLNPGDTALEYSISENDRPHRLVVSGLYELPFGRGRRFGAKIPPLLDNVIGGWQLNGVMARQSGPPLMFGDVILRGNVNDIALPSDQRSVDRWFNTSLFERDSKKQLDANFQVRTFPHFLSAVRGDGQSRLDLSLIRYFRLTDRVRMQFRAESYNVLNHPNFDTPSTDPTNKAFGTVKSQGGLSREFQFALSLVF